MSDENGKGPSAEFGCALGIILLLVGVMVGAWWAGRGVNERFDSIERSQERIRARLYEIGKKLEEVVDE